MSTFWLIIESVGRLLWDLRLPLLGTLTFTVAPVDASAVGMLCCSRLETSGLFELSTFSVTVGVFLSSVLVAVPDWAEVSEVCAARAFCAAACTYFCAASPVRPCWAASAWALVMAWASVVADSICCWVRGSR